MHQPRNWFLNKEDDSLKKRSLKTNRNGIEYLSTFNFVLNLSQDHISTFTSREELKAFEFPEEDEECPAHFMDSSNDD